MFVVEICFGIGLTYSRFFVVFFCLFQISDPVVADTKLQKGDIVITIRQDKTVGTVVFRSGQCSFIPVNGCVVIPLFQKMFSDVAT